MFHVEVGFFILESEANRLVLFSLGRRQLGGERSTLQMG